MTKNELLDWGKVMVEHANLTNQLTDRIIALEKKVEELDWLSHERNCVDPDHCKQC
jgi:hypothetical protein